MPYSFDNTGVHTGMAMRFMANDEQCPFDEQPSVGTKAHLLSEVDLHHGTGRSEIVSSQ